MSEGKKIDELLKYVQKIDQDISTLKEDVGSLKTDVSSLKEDSVFVKGELEKINNVLAYRALHENEIPLKQKG